MKKKLFDTPKSVNLTIEEADYNKLSDMAKLEDMLVGPYIRKIMKQHINCNYSEES